MLDNGYVYLAATRLSLYRSEIDWGLVIEVFGFSPRAGLPDVSVFTFASRLHERDRPEKYSTVLAYDNYLAQNPYNEFRSAYPIEDGSWLDADDMELVANYPTSLVLRGRERRVPAESEYGAHEIKLEIPPRVHVFELCRLLAATDRETVLATPSERRGSVAPELNQILQLEEWRHPDLLNDERPSGSTTFRQLAEVLVTGDVSRYAPSETPNTHWSNWPDGGLL